MVGALSHYRSNVVSIFAVLAAENPRKLLCAYRRVCVCLISRIFPIRTCTYPGSFDQCFNSHKLLLLLLLLYVDSYQLI
jgi:hypothetical protein